MRGEQKNNMSQLFVINSERRDWRRKDPQVALDKRSSKDVTRRYLLIVDQPEIRNVIKKEFTVYPHESNKEFVFYCITKPYYRRAKDFVKTISYKLKKSDIEQSWLNDLEILIG